MFRRTLNFNGLPMLLGGLASAEPLLERPGQLQSDDFVGCVHSVAVNGRALNLSNPLSAQGVDNTCSRLRGSCGAPDRDPCSGVGVCLARWPSPAMCRCPGGLLAPNCDAALSSVHLEDGAFLEARVSEQHRRMHLLESLYQGATAWRWQEELPLGSSSAPKRMAVTFRTVHKHGMLFVSNTNNDFTLIEVCFNFIGAPLLIRICEDRIPRIDTSITPCNIQCLNFLLETRHKLYLDFVNDLRSFCRFEVATCDTCHESVPAQRST
jgi:protocadherin Fat 4